MTALEVINDVLTEDVVREFLEIHGAKSIHKSKNGIRCCCPLHESDNASSFNWYLETNTWRCYVEQIGGNIITFIKYYYGVKSTGEALDIIAGVLNIDISGLESGVKELREKLEIKSWLKYINKETNDVFNMRTLGKRFGINNYRGIDKNLLAEHEVVFLEDFNRIAFPFYNENGDIVGASLRRYNESDKIKWLHKPEGVYTGLLLYNIHNCIGKYTEVYVVEGIMDALNLIRLGVKNVVATFGARVTNEQFLMLSKYFLTIILAFDNDEAGDLANRKVIETYKGLITIDVLVVTGIKDVGELKDIDEFNQLRRKKWYQQYLT